MAADDKERDERHQSRNLERDRGKHRRRHRHDSPSPSKQRRKRSRSPGAEEKHRHKNSAEKHEDSKGHELSNRNTEGMSEEDRGKEVARKESVQNDEKGGARKSSKEDRKVELHSSGDSSQDASSDSESDRGRKKKKLRSKNHKSRKSKSKHRRRVRSESEQDESQIEGTSGESSEDSEDEYRRAKRRKRLKKKEKAERERRRRKKEKKRKRKGKAREQEKKKEKVEELSKGPITESWGKYGIITELDMWTRRPEFSAWLAEVKKVNLETLTNPEEKDMFKEYMEDYNTATFPSRKYYNIDMYHHRKGTNPRKKGMKDMLNKQSERTEFNDEEQRRQELRAERAEMKETESEKMNRTMMETGMGKAMRDQALLREDIQYQYRLGNTEVCNQEEHLDVGDCLEDDNMHGNEGFNDDPILEPKHKIFLSHSGAQKEFVDHLCKALEDRCHYPFFDRRHESLPKGERFLELIVRAVEQCEMLIVVVSNEYFMSKWPMIELSTFVKAHELHHGSKIGPKILPLFYGLSVSDLDNEGMRNKWFREWKTLAEVDPKKRIVVSDWKNALDVLKSFNGLSYDRISKEIVAYEDKVVSHVCKSIFLGIKWDDSHVQGKSSICQVIHEKIEGIGISQKYNVKVVGIYGVGGIGKTTTCKTLCNELLSKYEGKVCHIEFPRVSSGDSKELFQKVVRDLTRKSMEVIQPLNEGECMDILHESLSKQRTFLAMDNISDNSQSLGVAKTFLEVPYHVESLVVVTARSRDVLVILGLDEDACLEMPDLGEADAMNLFLHHVAGGSQFFEAKEKHDIMTCVQRCYFYKGDGKGHHYHPLALKALGLQLSYLGHNPSDWVKNLPEVKTFDFHPGENPVFDILRSGFDLLPKRAKALFMDIAFFCECYIERWLTTLFKQDGLLAHQFELLLRKGLLQDGDMNSRRISMHDLYKEFGELEAKGSFNESIPRRERMWMYIEDDGDLAELEGGYWHNLIRLSINLDPGGYRIGRTFGQSMDGWRWDYFSNVEVLSLNSVHWGHGTLNLESLSHLWILELICLMDLDRVEGLEKLKHLTFIDWTSYAPHSESGAGAHIVGKLPLSLRDLSISEEEYVVLGSNVLDQCHNLSHLELYAIETSSLDLSHCQSLEHVTIGAIPNLQTLLGLDVCLPSNLHSFKILHCEDLVDIPGIDHLIGLKELSIENCPKWEVPSLLALTKLQVLSILGQHSLAVPPKNCFPRQLQKFHWHVSQSNEGLNLPGFNQLEVLDLSDSDGLISFADVGDLLALRCLDLRNCKHLLELPDLSKSKNLKELRLDGCSALELHERDIQMLSKLPLLQSLPF